MLENTIAWRKSFGVDRMIPEWRSTIELENQTGKMYTRGLDKEGHAIMYMKPSKENTGDFDGNMKHLVFNLEAAVKSMLDDGRGVEKLVLLVDYEGWSLANSPPMKTSQETMNILQNHYPERLFKAVCIHPPFVFSLFWAAICPFIDRVTQAKVMLLRFTPPVVTQKLLGTPFLDYHITHFTYDYCDLYQSWWMPMCWKVNMAGQTLRSSDLRTTSTDSSEPRATSSVQRGERVSLRF